jgi:8-oxo-dGTP pyrophosphatase MutT (NUDIX family)
MSDIICLNCGKKGHKFKDCKYPITSYGIICINYQEDNLITYIDNFKKSKYITIINTSDYNELIEKLHRDLKFLLVCRKDTLGYIEFIRGNYNIDDHKYIEELISYMTIKEKTRLLQNETTFDFLWIKLWSLDHQNVDNQRIENEYFRAKTKFENFKKKYNLKQLIQSSSTDWTTPEWGFPKGRRESNESDLKCACREFEEECGLKEDDYQILDIKPVYETFRGCNGVLYRHIYYIAQILTDNINLSKKHLHQVSEISAIQWVNYQQSMDLIRDYNKEKKKSLKYLFNLIKNIICASY